MDYPDGSDARSGRRQSMTETYLPQAEAAGARVLAGHRVDRLVLDGGRAFRADDHDHRRPAPPRSTSATSSSAAAPSRRRRCCSAPGCARHIGRIARRAPDGQAGRPLRRAGQRRRRRAGPPGQGVRPRPLLRRVGQPRPGWSRCALATTGTASARPSLDWRAPVRLLRGDHQRGPGPGAGAARPARPARHLPADPPRPATSSAGAWPAWPC